MGAPDGLTTTETRNPLTLELDRMTVVELLQVMNSEDRKVPDAIAGAIPEIALAVDLVVDALRTGGRLVYLGAGTSGRLGVLDAAECPPTFGTSPELVVGLLAGGDEAMFHAVEGAEDSGERAVADLRANRVRSSGRAGRHRRVRPHPLCHCRPGPCAPTGCGHGLDRLQPGRGGEPRGPGGHRAGQRSRGAHRFDAAQGGYQPEAGAQHDLDRRDGPARQGVRQPHGRRACPATRSWSTAPSASSRRRPAAPRTRRSVRWPRPTGMRRPRS